MKEVEISGCRIDPALLVQLSNLLNDVNETLIETIWQIEQGSSLVTEYLSVIQAIKNNEPPKFKIPVVESKMRLLDVDQIHKPKRVRNRKSANPRTGLSLAKTLMKLPAGPHTVEDCTKFVQDSEYKTTSEDLQGLVYQKICLLVTQGIYKKTGIGKTATYENRNAPIVVTEEKENVAVDSLGNGESNSSN